MLTILFSQESIEQRVFFDRQTLGVTHSRYTVPVLDSWHPVQTSGMSNIVHLPLGSFFILHPHRVGQVLDYENTRQSEM